jgi:hypothetical protein
VERWIPGDHVAARAGCECQSGGPTGGASETEAEKASRHQKSTVEDSQSEAAQAEAEAS